MYGTEKCTMGPYILLMCIPANWLAGISLVCVSIAVQLVASLSVAHKQMIINGT